MALPGRGTSQRQIQMEEVRSWLFLLNHGTHFSICNSNYAKVFIVGRAVGKQTLSRVAGGSVNCYNIYGVNLAISFELQTHTLLDPDIQPSKNLSNGR